jgi:hypothetical protein
MHPRSGQGVDHAQQQDTDAIRIHRSYLAGGDAFLQNCGKQGRDLPSYFREQVLNLLPVKLCEVT